MIIIYNGNTYLFVETYKGDIAVFKNPKDLISNRLLIEDALGTFPDFLSAIGEII